MNKINKISFTCSILVFILCCIHFVTFSLYKSTYDFSFVYDCAVLGYLPLDLLSSLGSAAGWLAQDDSPLLTGGGLVGGCPAQPGWPELCGCSTDTCKKIKIRKTQQ